MPYQILDIKTTRPEAFSLYFLDSNVWLYQFSPAFALNTHQKRYTNFISAVIRLHQGSGDVKPKFVMLSLLFSEVINAALRFDMRSKKITDFKKVYRLSSDYSTALSKITSDLSSYEPYMEIMDDGFNSMDPFGKILPSLSSQFDFNDLYFGMLMKAHNIAIVTNDADFAFEDVPIITANGKLLGLK